MEENTFDKYKSIEKIHVKQIKTYDTKEIKLLEDGLKKITKNDKKK